MRCTGSLNLWVLIQGKKIYSFSCNILSGRYFVELFGDFIISEVNLNEGDHLWCRSGRLANCTSSYRKNDVTIVDNDEDLVSRATDTLR